MKCMHVSLNFSHIRRVCVCAHLLITPNSGMSCYEIGVSCQNEDN